MKSNKQRKMQPDKTGSMRAIVTIGICVLLFVAGFFFAGRQHFSSMDYGMKNSKLRKQIEDLESEKRRLILAREISMSPNEIRKAAKKAGLTDSASVQGQVAQTVAAASKEKVDAPSTQASTNPLVIKTASIAVTQRPVVAAVKVDKAVRPVKQAEPAPRVSKRTVAAE